mgnify:FL=1
MRKVKKTFYIDEKIAELLRDYAHLTHKTMSKIVEEAIELLEKYEKNTILS